MSRALARTSLVALISFGLAVPPSAVAKATMQVTPEMALEANRKVADPEISLQRALPGVPQKERSAALKQKSLAVLSKMGGIGEDIVSLQAVIVMTAAMSYQVAREHGERIRLSNGLAKDAGPDSALSIFFGPEAWSAIFGSGEFYLGALATSGVLATNKLSGFILNSILKNAAKRNAFITLMGAMVNQTTLMAAGTAAGFTWTEGVKALSTVEDIKRAEGLAGRALAASTDWSTFAASEDGRVFRAILENIKNLLIVDAEKREQWIYNTWRFGAARGEFMAAVGTLMGSGLAAQAIVGAFSMGPVTGAVVSAVVGGALGMAGMTILFGAEAPQKMTKLIQNARTNWNKSGMRNARKELAWYSSYLKFAKRPSHQPSQVAYWKMLFKTAIDRLNSAREDYANVMIERFYELLLETKRFESQIAIAEATLKDPKFLQQIYLEQDGQIVSYEKARERACGGSPYCEMPGTYQLQALDRYRALLVEANQELVKLGSRIIGAYDRDEQMMRDVIEGDGSYDPVGELAQTLTNQMIRSALLAINLRYVLGGAHKPLGDAIEQTFTDEQRAEFTKDLGGYYTQVYSEQKIFVEMLKTPGAQANAR